MTTSQALVFFFFKLFYRIYQQGNLGRTLPWGSFKFVEAIFLFVLIYLYLSFLLEPSLEVVLSGNFSISFYFLICIHIVIHNIIFTVLNFHNVREGWVFSVFLLL